MNADGHILNDGHVSGVPITHIGFLSTRHTALVSADNRGMAFSHLATRGLGAVGRIVKTTRILGRYPSDRAVADKPRKPSTVLAFAPLPLGNVERSTDGLGLTAMLTPYLLVIVSTTPVAHTHHKASRPKEVAAHSAMSGCLAWFPAVKLKVPDPNTGGIFSKVKLVYCWSNVLTVLEVNETESADKDKPASLSFHPRSRWKADEPIVAVQWLSRSVLTVLTITQRLVVLEDQSMRMTEAFDLVGKHILHQDLFSEQLHSLVEQLDEDDTSMHGVVADAFYMSFKAYKGRMFLLGFNDISMGTLSNWADRLIALMEDGDYIGALQLATSYYTGEADKLTVGLPEDMDLRHSMVRDKLLEIMSASLKYAFGQGRKNVDADVYDAHLKELAEVCFIACLNIDDIDFLFDEVYEWYENSEVQGLFLETLEPYILDQRISTVPPTVIKAMVHHYVQKDWHSRLEEMICHMETATLDLDQITTLCKQHNLYDALIYVWNRALGDFITPLIDLLTVLKSSSQGGNYFQNGGAMDDPIHGIHAQKMFPYMSYTFTGRIYPTGAPMEEEQASLAKAELYWFLFSGKTITWPKGTTKQFLTTSSEKDEPPYPYLRLILKFDAPSFLSVMNEAFEDSFLNHTHERAVNGGSNRNLSEEHVFGLSINRQYIVSILLEIMNTEEFGPEDTIYLDMFIARNLPKFPQYLLFSGSSVHKVLAGLCNYPGQEIADDAQLSVEYLLSVYHPPELTSLIPLFEDAGFYRVLKSIHKADGEYAKLLQAYFDDHEDREAVFDCITDCLRPRGELNKRQVREFYAVIESHAEILIEMDAARTAQVIQDYAPTLHENILDAMTDGSYEQYLYLQTILQPLNRRDDEQVSQPGKKEFVESYIRLMCLYDSSKVAAYIDLLQASNLRLDRVLPAMEHHGVVDAAVILMAREGQLKEAMERLAKHLQTLESALVGLLGAEVNGDGGENISSGVEELLETLQKYTGVGIWLCQRQAKATVSRDRNTLTPVRRKSNNKADLSLDETLWLDLIDVTVQITKNISASLSNISSRRGPDSEEDNFHLDIEALQATLRTLVQRTFTALLTSTSTPHPSSASLSFLRILRAFLTRASLSSPRIADLRSVLSSIFSAYAYEESILSLSNRLLDRDLFVNVQEASERRQRGWRPKGSLCEGCGKRVWGPGAAGNIVENWEHRQEIEARNRKERRAKLAGASMARGKEIDRSSASETHNQESSTGKGQSDSANKATAQELDNDGDEEEDMEDKARKKQEDLGPLVVLACRHMYHRKCLQDLQVEQVGLGRDEAREFKCPVDG